MKIKYIILLFSFFLVTQQSFAKDLEVCSSCQFKTLKSAIVAAEDGDKVIVKGGIYKEGNIVIKKSIHLVGIDFPILDGENETEILTIRASGVTIEGFQIQNVGTSYIEDRAGIRFERANNFVVKNNRLINTFFGIYLAHSNDGIVEGNYVEGEAVQEMSSGNAIHIWYCKRVRVENNEVRNHRDGIYFEFVYNSLVQNNLSEGNLRYGLHFMFSDDDNYYKNEFRDNGAGVAVMFSRRINMSENLFVHNWGKASFGLLLKEINDAEITNNRFVDNTIGIFVEGSNRINYTNNDFVGNGWAMKVSGGCLDNKVSENNFISNTFDLALNSSSYQNSIDGNYWSEYSGYDLDRNGVGDIPHRPIKLFNYVLKNTPEAMVLMRSLFIDLINFSEKVSPVFTPANVLDNQPAMKKFSRS
jgi:nitrous oxidase accessory protein